MTNEQIQGLHDGYHLYGSNSALNFIQMWYLSAGEDIADISTGLTNVQRNAQQRLTNDKCSASVRFNRAANDLYVSHTTWLVIYKFVLFKITYKFRTEFSQMYRTLKTYDFKLKTSNGKLVKGQRIKLSSYPGCIYSSDDFYQIGSLAVVETTGDVDNTTLWKQLTPESVLSYARAMIAGRLAKSAADWVDIFVKYNSGK